MAQKYIDIYLCNLSARYINDLNMNKFERNSRDNRKANVDLNKYSFWYFLAKVNF